MTTLTRKDLGLNRVACPSLCCPISNDVLPLQQITKRLPTRKALQQWCLGNNTGLDTTHARGKVGNLCYVVFLQFLDVVFSVSIVWDQLLIIKKSSYAVVYVHILCYETKSKAKVGVYLGLSPCPIAPPEATLSHFKPP